MTPNTFVGECVNGYIHFYVKSESRYTIRHETQNCPHCHAEAPNDFQALPDEIVITAKEFYYLRDECNWEIQTLDDAAFHFKYNMYQPVLSPTPNKPN